MPLQTRLWKSCKRGDKVSLVGFGSFEARQRQAKEGRNPKTGEKMQIAATRVPDERCWQVV
jgi:DNA-binding protein HU-beta|nr:HU family DNA-binding protein [Chroococcidiopsis sp. CCALA 051]